MPSSATGHGRAALMAAAYSLFVLFSALLLSFGFLLVAVNVFHIDGEESLLVWWVSVLPIIAVLSTVSGLLTPWYRPSQAPVRAIILYGLNVLCVLGLAFLTVWLLGMVF